ncbi:MAG: ABC transporter ATP-binding protein, partial [Selenomonadaceae bacterium]|nr:ABC transporter ATP-binding protein [Selenomonadaceae bacterium]
MRNYKRLLAYIKPYLGLFGLAIICIILASGANLYLPWIIKDMIDKVLAERDMEMLNFISVSIVVVFAFRGFFYYWQSYLVSYIGQRVVVDVREVMFRKFQRMPMAYFDKHQTGETMSYLTNDVNAIQSALVDNLIDMFTEGAILIGSIAMMLYLDWKLTLLTLVTVPLVGSAMRIFGKKIKSTSRVIQEKLADITSLLQESISSIRVVKSFVREGYEIERFKVENELNFKATIDNVKISSLLTPTVEFLAAVAVTFIVWFGGYEVVNGIMSAGALVAFLTYAVNLANPVKRLSRIYGKIQKAMAAIDRIFHVLDMPESVNDKPDAIELPKVSGKVSVKNVTFSYDGIHNALEDVSFDVQPGQMIAFVGPSGAGKSTIANLIPRFYDVTAGAIEIDGHDIRDVKVNSLRE